MQTVITIADKCEYLLIKITSALSLTAGVHSTAILKKHELLNLHWYVFAFHLVQSENHSNQAFL